MRRFLPVILLMLVLSLVAISAVGCHGMGETAAEKSDDNARTMRLNGSMLVDDIDMIFGLEHPSRLSEYTSR
ncbi:MAG: hypothetical protein KJ757_03045 [Planctomycetes bacterium]|nr:hypothetical protein [Planctomycetota bacterium]MBU1518975.1 hypothetical protein [Planctomycetota bacterium]MBU2457474.1 hypothetical protein [Planctomycetota bacterium]MBU2596527.1 hypothetical protein [Planctomycetota bacterium]